LAAGIGAATGVAVGGAISGRAGTAGGISAMGKERNAETGACDRDVHVICFSRSAMIVNRSLFNRHGHPDLHQGTSRKGEHLDF
jgi:hypothetical protein